MYNNSYRVAMALMQAPRTGALAPMGVGAARYSAVTCGIIYIYVHYTLLIQCSMAGHQRTAGIPAGGGRADTPAGGGQVGIPAGATLRMGIHAHATGVGEGGH